MAREMLCPARDMSKTAINPIDSAKHAGLRYVSGEVPGITRRKKGRGFAYFAADGALVRQDATLQRIRSLVIPPAWTRVWICPQAEGHLQAVGRDARGRKQYRYHPLYREVRDQVKFDRMVSFGTALTKIRRRIRRDLKLPGMPKLKILAALLRLLDETCVRVGNDEYTRSNGSYGLTTLHNKHAAIRGSELRLHFRGKSGQAQDVTLHDDQLARIVKRCQDLPGAELFQYESESGELQSIGSGDVNDYLREMTGEDITATDSPVTGLVGWPKSPRWAPSRPSMTAQRWPVAMTVRRLRCRSSPELRGGARGDISRDATRPCIKPAQRGLDLRRRPARCRMGEPNAAGDRCQRDSRTRLRSAQPIVGRNRRPGQARRGRPCPTAAAESWPATIC